VGARRRNPLTASLMAFWLSEKERPLQRVADLAGVLVYPRSERRGDAGHAWTPRLLDVERIGRKPVQQVGEAAVADPARAPSVNHALHLLVRLAKTSAFPGVNKARPTPSRSRKKARAKRRSAVGRG